MTWIWFIHMLQGKSISVYLAIGTLYDTDICILSKYKQTVNSVLKITTA